MTNTIKDILDYGGKELTDTSLTPVLDSEIILSHVLQRSRAFLRGFDDKVVNKEQIEVFNQLLLKRKQRVPIAYLTNNKEFFSLDFFVNESVLIPRPETELLVEEAITFINQKNSTLNIIDLGTGSGCIAVSVAVFFKTSGISKDSKMIAVDKHLEALKVARTNATKHGVDTLITFSESNWFSEISEELKFDLILANPPYISRDEDIHCKDILHEPHSALFAEKEGFADLEKIILSLDQRLKTGGIFLCETGETQCEKLMNFCNKSLRREHKFEILSDLSNKNRFIKITFTN